jgi:hypothetical protein
MPLFSIARSKSAKLTFNPIAQRGSRRQFVSIPPLSQLRVRLIWEWKLLKIQTRTAKWFIEDLANFPVADFPAQIQTFGCLCVRVTLSPGVFKLATNRFSRLIFGLQPVAKSVVLAQLSQFLHAARAFLHNIWISGSFQESETTYTSLSIACGDTGYSRYCTLVRTALPVRIYLPAAGRRRVAGVVHFGDRTLTLFSRKMGSRSLLVALLVQRMNRSLTRVGEGLRAIRHARLRRPNSPIGECDAHASDTNIVADFILRRPLKDKEKSDW